MPLRLLVTVLCLGSLTYAKPTPRRAMILICYPSDTLTPDECDAMETKMKGCGFSVRRLNDPDPKDILDLRKEAFPEHVTAFVSGHGNQTYDADGKRFHYLLRSDARRIHAQKVREALTAALPSPSIWLSACRAGAACTEDATCFGGACLGFEFASYAKKIENTMSDIGDLLCDPSAAAWGTDGVIDGAELNKVFCDKYGGPRGPLEVKVPAAQAENVRKRLATQPGVIKVEDETYSLGRGGSSRVTTVKFTVTFVDNCTGTSPQTALAHTFKLYSPGVIRTPSSIHPPDL